MLYAGVRAPTHRDVARGFVPPVNFRPRRPAQPTRFAAAVPLQVGPVNDGRREGTRNRRAAQRHRALGRLGLRADESLRLGSVKAETLKTYRIEVRGFRLWCRRNNVSLPRGCSPAALAVVDRALGKYVAHLYQRGFGPGKARHVMYGYIFLHTETEGRARPFPRTVRIIKGFSRKVATTTKSPLPKSVVYALAHKMCLKHGWRSGFAVVLQMDTYLRAHSLLDLERADFHPPPRGTRANLKKAWALMIAPLERGRPTKSGQFNETVLVGDLDPWIPTFMNSCVKRLPVSGKIFDFSHEEFARRLQDAARQLQLPYRVSPHQLRHSGPSHDKYYNRRDLPEIQSRGLWRQLQSVKIYEKHALLLQMWSLLSPAVRRDCQRLGDALPAVLTTAIAPPRKRPRC